MKLDVFIMATASKCIGQVDADSVEDFEEKAEELWKEKGYETISGNVSNDFDIGDSIVDVTDAEDAFKDKEK